MATVRDSSGNVPFLDTQTVSASDQVGIPELDAVTNPLASSLVEVSEIGSSKKETVAQLHQRIINTVAGTTHTFSSATDLSPAYVRFTSATAVTATVPANATDAFPIGAEIVAVQAGAGAVTIAAAGGVIINTRKSLLTNAAGSEVRLRKAATNEWDAAGDFALPAFLVYLATTQSNETGNGTFATVDFDTKQFDVGNDFGSSLFTAPVTGKYFLQASVRIEGITAAADDITIRFETFGEPRMSRFKQHTNDLEATQTMQISGVLKLDASDTAKVEVRVRGEASDVCDITGNSEITTFFSGHLVA